MPFSFPSSAWERRSRSSASRPRHRLQGELLDLRSQAELGNEEFEALSFISFYLASVISFLLNSTARAGR
jgi:hypothetical protein